MLKVREEARAEAGEVEEAREVEEAGDEDRADNLLTALRSLIERGIVQMFFRVQGDFSQLA